MLSALLLAAIAAGTAFLPPDDPGFRHCLDPSHGIRLEWQRPEDGAATYLLVKRLDAEGRWHPWLSTRRADPPFILTLHSPLARESRFAWMLFEVKGKRRSEGSWRYFCTAPGAEAEPEAGVIY
jgi:hypothetical protein